MAFRIDLGRHGIGFIAFIHYLIEQMVERNEIVEMAVAIDKVRHDTPKQSGCCSPLSASYPFSKVDLPEPA